MTGRRRWMPRILLAVCCIALGFGFAVSLTTTPHVAVVDTYTSEGN